jgi:hypothetical protein
MDKNLSWTSSLGDAYYNQEQDVMDAVQVMRRKAQDAGNLKTTPQLKVTDQDSAIDIEPVDPDVVYVPAYDPWLIYGYPVVAWPGWYPYPESGLTVPTSHSGSASESGGSAVTDGDGITGDLTGITTRSCSITPGIPRGAPRSITAAISIAAMRAGAELSIIPVLLPGRSEGTIAPPGDMLRRAARVGSAQVPSAASSVAERPQLFLTRKRQLRRRLPRWRWWPSITGGKSSVDQLIES